MEFFYDRVTSDSYGQVIRTRSASREDMFDYANRQIIQDNKWIDGKPCVVNTRVIRHRWWKRKHDLFIPAFDCDGLDEMLATTHWINTRYDSGVAIIQSSPSHYWVLMDRVMTLAPILDIMSKMPGIDTKYFNFSTDKRTLFLRCLPTSSLSLPILQETTTLLDSRVIEWYEAFREHWTSAEVREFQYKLSLMSAIKDKTMLDHAMNPGFVL